MSVPRLFLLAVIGCGLLLGWSGRAVAQVHAPRLTDSHRRSDDEKIQLIAEHLVKTYSRHLRDADPVVRSMALIGLARLDDTRSTEKLLLALKTDQHKLVRLFAWEALRSRADRLGLEEHNAWLLGGLQSAYRGMVPGNFRAHLLAALTPKGPNAYSGRAQNWMLMVLDDCDHQDPHDSRTLQQIRKTVAAWHDPRLIRRLAAQIGQGGDKAHKAEYVLGGLTDSIEPVGSIQPGMEISRQQWQQVKLAWLRWTRDANLTAARPGEIPADQPERLLLPRPEKIENPDDPQWRDDLELDKLRVDKLEVCFAIDSTGSMIPAMKWVAGDVIKMAQILGMVGREIHMGAVFFRDEPMVGNPADYLLKGVKMTGDIKDLARDLAREPAGSGRGRGAAMLEALQVAIRKQNWTSSPRARKVVLLISDTFPIANTELQIQQLVSKAAQKDGFVIHTLRVGPDQIPAHLEDQYLPKMAAIARASGGKSLVMRFKPALSPAAGGQGWPQIAPPIDDSGSHLQTVVTTIIQSTLPEDYCKRVEPLVAVMLELARDPMVR